MNVDIAIVGAGLVGCSIARALCRSGLSIALIEPRSPRPLPAAGFDLRVYALNPRSVRCLEGWGVWPRLAQERVTPVHEMLVFGDGNSKLEFSSYRSGVFELAAIVEESNLQQALTASLDGQPDLALSSGVECLRANWMESAAVLALSDGSELEARLVIAADGAESRMRSLAGIEVRVHEYGQKGVVANFHVDKPHRNVAYQWFRKDGVLALLPLPQGQVSMVWSTADAHAQDLLAMSGEELARAVGDAASHRLGAMRISGAAAAFALRRLRAKRLITPRLALLGDAAHNVHPLAGQGLNLGIADVESLAGVIGGRGLESDSGATALLRRYERSRKEDILAMECVTDGLHKLFSSSLPGLPWLRNSGLNLTNQLRPLKKLLVKRALGNAV
ncbi:MAG TPA: UbiH/UbiF family hydroxylase [Burkholderiales bacterium]|jgi:ubiquinone biosynthesis UbiH/UbiF/VisC/COQ6 family hydroxylase|nr:UbiH/UbiF family hydroxylase [Burkholderiales bacterium]